jgi:hypothetical protein
MDIEVGGYPGFRLGFGYFSGFRGIIYFRPESQSDSCILLSQHDLNNVLHKRVVNTSEWLTQASG